MNATFDMILHYVTRNMFLRVNNFIALNKTTALHHEICYTIPRIIESCKACTKNYVLIQLKGIFKKYYLTSYLNK